MIEDQEKEELLRVLDSGMLAAGDWVKEFEKKFAEKMGVPYGIATSSGTTALHGALMAAGISSGHRVITTPFTFIASSNAVLFCGGRPLFADIQEETFNIDPERLQQALTKDPGIRALVVVHLYGLPAAMDEIMALVKEYDLLLIEDCAQAHGATFRGQPVGSFGHLSIFSFYPTKNMTTGEGGMILTHDVDLMKRVRSLINHGEGSRYYHQDLGYNFRMSNMAAALGKVQLKKLDGFNQRRQENARYLTSGLAYLPGIKTPQIPEGCHHVFHQYTIRVEKGRDELAASLKEKEIGCGIHYPLPVNRQPVYESLGLNSEVFPVAEKMSREVLSLPVHPSLSRDDLDQIVAAVSSFARKRSCVF